MQENKKAQDLAERIRQILRERNLRQVEFAKSVGVSANYIYLLTSGRKTSVSETLAKLIENIYGYSADWVRFGTKEETDGGPLGDLQSDTIQKLRQMDYAELRAVAAFIRTLEETAQ